MTAFCTPDPDAPHPLAYPVDPTDRDGEQVPTWELPGRFVQRLGDEWECWRLGAPHPMWTRPSPRATTEGLFLVRRVAPPAPPQPETVTVELPRDVALAWASESVVGISQHGVVEHLRPALLAALADGGES